MTITTIVLLMLAAWLGPLFVVGIVLWWVLPTWLVILAVVVVVYLVGIREEQRELTAWAASRAAARSALAAPAAR
jgi:hypothetical protein